jgi:ankyrin repeat protein
MTGKQPKRLPRPGVDEYGRTPMHYAALSGNGGEIHRLFLEGADPNAQDDNGFTPLHFAAQQNSVVATEALLSIGAQMEIKDAYGNTPLFKAVFSCTGSGSVIVILREAGADPYSKNNYDVSPLSLARTIANFDVAQFFKDLP